MYSQSSVRLCRWMFWFCEMNFDLCISWEFNCAVSGIVLVLEFSVQICAMKFGRPLLGNGPFLHFWGFEMLLMLVGLHAILAFVIKCWCCMQTDWCWRCLRVSGVQGWFVAWEGLLGFHGTYLFKTFLGRAFMILIVWTFICLAAVSMFSVNQYQFMYTIMWKFISFNRKMSVHTISCYADFGFCI